MKKRVFGYTLLAGLSLFALASCGGEEKDAEVKFLDENGSETSVTLKETTDNETAVKQYRYLLQAAATKENEYTSISCDGTLKANFALSSDMKDVLGTGSLKLNASIKAEYEEKDGVDYSYAKITVDGESKLNLNENLGQEFATDGEDSSNITSLMFDYLTNSALNGSLTLYGESNEGKVYIDTNVSKLVLAGENQETADYKMKGYYTTEIVDEEGDDVAYTTDFFMLTSELLDESTLECSNSSGNSVTFKSSINQEVDDIDFEYAGYLNLAKVYVTFDTTTCLVKSVEVNFDDLFKTDEVKQTFKTASLSLKLSFDYNKSCTKYSADAKAAYTEDLTDEIDSIFGGDANESQDWYYGQF